jgi:hypothetical protein
MTPKKVGRALRTISSKDISANTGEPAPLSGAAQLSPTRKGWVKKPKNPERRRCDTNFLRKNLIPSGILRALFFILASTPLLPFGGAQSLRPAQTTPHTDVLDIHHLPLGDGKISAIPQSGYVMSCQTSFNGGRGAQNIGPWIHGTTWDLAQKIKAQGRVMWPQAEFRITTQTGNRVVSRIVNGNGLPVDTPTGTFPIGYDDPAFEIDRNPNSISPQQIALTLPANPEVAAAASCVPMGVIGMALNGVPIYNALDEAGRDAVAHEVQDLCNGHPQMQGQYHYHGPSPCLPSQTANETLIGYALDGFGIYSLYDAHGRELTDADLDECHGRTARREGGVISAKLGDGDAVRTKAQRPYHPERPNSPIRLSSICYKA